MEPADHSHEPATRPRRQEQEKATEEVTEVAEGILRMQLPISMPGLGHVNCYAILDSEGATVVDPGMPTPGSFRALEARLARAQLGVKVVHTVLVTHSHPDHFGGASRIIARSGASLIAHRSFSLGFAKPHDDPEVSVDDLRAHEEAEAGRTPDGEPARQQVELHHEIECSQRRRGIEQRPQHERR